jgi:hypothetical protein
VLELLDDEFLLGDHVLHQVADGDEAHQLAFVEHGQVAEAVLGHQRQAFLGRAIGAHVHHLRGHDLAHRRVPRGLRQAKGLAREVALGHDADDAAAFEHQQPADVLLGHQLHGLEHRGRGGDGVDSPVGLRLENLRHGRHQRASFG